MSMSYKNQKWTVKNKAEPQCRMAPMNTDAEATAVVPATGLFVDQFPALRNYQLFKFWPILA